jgi:hypothetical protein
MLQRSGVGLDIVDLHDDAGVHDHPAQRLRQWCLASFGPWRCQADLAGKELAFVIDQRHQTNR